MLILWRPPRAQPRATSCCASINLIVRGDIFDYLIAFLAQEAILYAKTAADYCFLSHQNGGKNVDNQIVDVKKQLFPSCVLNFFYKWKTFEKVILHGLNFY